MKNIPLSVILMVYNEEETIEDEIQKYYHEIIKKIPHSELIIAEDGSSDKTRTILYSLAKKIPLVLSVTPQKIGYANSLRNALLKSKGDITFYADAGNKHDSKDFWCLYEKIDVFDFITGFKKKRHDPRHRLILAWGLNRLVNLYFGVKFSDIDCGFKLFNRNAKKIILQNRWILSNNISLEIVLRVCAAGLKTTEIPIAHFARLHGPSRGLPPKKIPRAVFNILRFFPKLKKEIMEAR